jgi:alkaline phosphatase D
MQYYYQFNVCGSSNKSPLGRTKTSPNHDDDVSKVALAVFSCSNWQNGYFNAYGNAARKDNVDFFVHLGDYIYESGKGTLGQDPRATNPSREIITLYDYRTRIGQYRTDPDLRLAHQDFAWIPTWDDHEVANNGYRDGFSGMNNTEASFLKFGGVSVDSRKMNAVRAYFEWMPIRQVDMDDNLRIWRSFKMGKLFDLIMLDTRNYDRSVTTLNWNDDYIAHLKDDAGRSLMGSHQENWFYNQLSESHQRGAMWRVVGNQIIFSRMNNSAVYSNPLNADQWDVSTVDTQGGELRLTCFRATRQIATAPFITSTRTRSPIQLSWLETVMRTGCRT